MKPEISTLNAYTTSALNGLGGLIEGMTLSDRILEIVAAGFKRADIARAAGKTPSAVSQWLSGLSQELKADSAAGIQNLTGFSAVWIATGRGPKMASKLRDASNVELGPDLHDKVPLISSVQAGAWCCAEDPFQPGDAEKWMLCPVNHGPLTYALRVKGDSMTAPTGNSRTYPENCIVFVDPDRNSPVNGERIIAKLAGTDEVTFKVYKEEDGRRWLQPLNPTHLPIRDEFSVCGTVIGKWEDE